MNILIVDDIEDNVLVLRAFLSGAGFSDILSVSNAKEAYLLLGSPDYKTKPDIDLILMDLMMPEISGIEACSHIKGQEILKEIPIIMVTARTDIESLDAAFKAGAVDYLTKPVKKIELLARIRSALKLKEEMDRRKKRELELSKKNAELQQAMNEIKTLKGFLPICSHCKKIRTDDGYWQQLEVYFSQHADLKFSHGVCESCMKQHYPSQRDDKHRFD